MALRTRLGPVAILAEGALTFLGDPDNLLGLGSRTAGTGYEKGLYVYPHLKLGPTTSGVRYDLIVPHPTVNADGTTTAAPKQQQLALSSMVKPATLWNLRAELSVPLDSASADTMPVKFTLMTAFYF